MILNSAIETDIQKKKNVELNSVSIKQCLRILTGLEWVTTVSLDTDYSMQNETSFFPGAINMSHSVRLLLPAWVRVPAKSNTATWIGSSILYSEHSC